MVLKKIRNILPERFKRKKEFEESSKQFPAEQDSVMFSVLINKECIGNVGLSRIDWHNKSSEYTIFIKKEKRNRGYGKTALKLLLEFAKNKGIYNLLGIIDCNNISSVKLALSMGFEIQGPLDYLYLKPIYISGIDLTPP